MMRIQLETTVVQGIPVLALAPETAQACPLIFHISGYGSNKESGLSLGCQLAGRGFFFVSFDAWMHGERRDDRLFRAAEPDLGGIYPAETGLDVGVTFYGVIGRCLEDVRTLLSHYAGDPRVDASRCGVTGHSMGAYASFLIFANLGQVQAAVPMMGVPSFLRRWEDILDECAFSNAAWAAALQRVAVSTRQHTAYVREIDPYDRLKEAAPRALLMMSGDFDTDQPKLYSIYAYRELREVYAASPDRLKLNIYPVGHTVTPEMERDAVEWFVRHLMV